MNNDSPFEKWRRQNMMQMAVPSDIMELIARAFEGGRHSREWVGLTMEEVQEVLNDPRYQMKPLIVHAVEAKLRSKNEY